MTFWNFCFSDESTLHVSGKLNRHIVHILGSELPPVTRKVERASLKVIVWCGLLHNFIISSFFFSEATANSDVYLHMLQEFAVPQLKHLQPHENIYAHGNTEGRRYQYVASFQVSAKIVCRCWFLSSQWKYPPLDGHVNHFYTPLCVTQAQQQSTKK